MLNYLYKFKFKDRLYKTLNEDNHAKFIRYNNKMQRLKLKKFIYYKFYKNEFFSIRKRISFFFIKRINIFLTTIKYRNVHFTDQLTNKNYFNNFTNLNQLEGYTLLRKHLSKSLIKKVLDINLRNLFCIITKLSTIFYYFKYWTPKSKKRHWLFSKNSKTTKHFKTNTKQKLFFQLLNKFKFKRKYKFQKINENSYNQSISYKGWFYNLNRLYIQYGCLNIPIIKKYTKHIKNNYKKYKLFYSYLNCKLFILFYQLYLINNIKACFFYIKKYGININNNSIYKPNYIIKEFDLIILNKMIKKKLIFIQKKKKYFFFFSFLRNINYTIIINFKIFAFIVIFKNFKINLSFNKYLKKKHPNYTFNNSYFFNVKYYKRRK
jgi:hypothetical protein